MKPFAVITQDTCKWCHEAEFLLDQKGLDYENFNVRQWQIREFVKAAGFKTVPQIFHDGKHIGGYEDLKMYLLQEDANEQT